MREFILKCVVVTICCVTICKCISIDINPCFNNTTTLREDRLGVHSEPAKDYMLIDEKTRFEKTTGTLEYFVDWSHCPYKLGGKDYYGGWVKTENMHSSQKTNK